MTEWCHEFDFVKSQAGWLATSGQPGGNYQSGIGWRSVSGYNGKVIYISYALPASIHITQVKLIFS